MKIKGALAVLALIIAGLPVLLLRAQPTAEQQLQNTQQSQQQSALNSLIPGTNAPELYPGENADIGPQRILRLTPRPTPFEVYLDSQFFYTNNATFAASQKIGSDVFVNTAQIAYSPGPYKWGSGTIGPSVGIASQWYNYGRSNLHSLSFDAQTAFINFRYNWGPRWQISGGGNYTRLLKPNYEESYREYLPNIGVQRLFTLRDNLVLVLNDQVAYHFTYVPPLFGGSTDLNDRLDETVGAAFAWQLTPHLIVQPYYRFMYSYYRKNTLQNSSRDDYLHTGGITFAYYFTKYASARVFFNYNAKHTSDVFVPNYQEYDAGPGVTLDFKF